MNDEKTLNEKDIFFQDIENCKSPFTHITKEDFNPLLNDIDRLFGAADVLSIENQNKHKLFLLGLAIVGGAIVFFFLLYDEMELYYLIGLCMLLVFVLFGMDILSNKVDSHRKYLEYRVLAETLRVQFFLYYAGLEEKVVDIMPWFIREGIPWIEEILLALPVVKTGERKSILDCWIRDQKTYHMDALKRAKADQKTYTNLTYIAIIFTVFLYAVTLAFEILMYKYSPGDANWIFVKLKILLSMIDANRIRAYLKIGVGTMSTITVIGGSYFGKKSLPNEIEDHERMIALYDKVENEIMESGEDREQLIYLAREFLTENSTWYSYQTQNNPDIVI